MTSEGKVTNDPESLRAIDLQSERFALLTAGLAERPGGGDDPRIDAGNQQVKAPLLP